MKIQIAYINESKELSDAEATRIVSALQHQVYHDFRPAWGITADLRFYDLTEKPPENAWVVAFLDDADQANALGYHDLTKTLRPMAKVFVSTTLADGALVSVTASHETLELLGDPYINVTALDPDTGRLYAMENADAVEADELGYSIGNVRVSDFVLPPYFDPQHKGKGVPLSFCGHVHEPFQLARGGYLSYLDLGNISKGWQQEFAREVAEGDEPMEGTRPKGFPPGSRRERRTRAWKRMLTVSTAV